MGKFINALLMCGFIFSNVSAVSYYVSPSGADTNPGTFAAPFKTIEKGITISAAGDTVFVKGGTYVLSSTIRLSKSGSENVFYHLMAYPGERVLLDFSGQALSSSNRGILITGSYWHVEGFDIIGAGDNGMKIETGGYNRIINCSFYRNRDSGLQIGNGSGYNRIINCDSYFNADPPDYGDADGFAAKLDVGAGNYFYGCRAWSNCDDGWDGYLRGTDNVSTILENCWAFHNGYLEDGTDPGPQANGNGFKMGGSDDKLLRHDYTLTACLSFDNKVKGFDQNSNMGSMILFNCTGHNNLGGNYVIAKDLAAGKVLIIKNSSALGSVGNIAAFAVQEANSWMNGIVVSDLDYISVDPSSAYGQRNADGSLSGISYLALAEGSDMIDAGVDTGLPFNGSAPDIGYAESAYNLSSGKDFQGNVPLKFNCYPNPASGFVTFTFSNPVSEKITLNIYDLSGRKILKMVSPEQGTDTGKIEVSLRGVKPGLYVYEISTGSKIPLAGKLSVR